MTSRCDLTVFVYISARTLLLGGDFRKPHLGLVMFIVIDYKEVP
jgi:hypothetical protein